MERKLIFETNADLESHEVVLNVLLLVLQSDRFSCGRACELNNIDDHLLSLVVEHQMEGFPLMQFQVVNSLILFGLLKF